MALSDENFWRQRKTVARVKFFYINHFSKVKGSPWKFLRTNDVEMFWKACWKHIHETSSRESMEKQTVTGLFFYSLSELLYGKPIYGHKSEMTKGIHKSLKMN